MVIVVEAYSVWTMPVSDGGRRKIQDTEAHLVRYSGFLADPLSVNALHRRLAQDMTCLDGSGGDV
jgi:hypothetical protein